MILLDEVLTEELPELIEYRLLFLDGLVVLLVSDLPALGLGLRLDVIFPCLPRVVDLNHVMLVNTVARQR